MTGVTDDANDANDASSAGAAAGRQFDQLAMIHRLPKATVVDRIAFLTATVAGRSVIHVGFADAGCEHMQAEVDAWLHEHLAESASSIVGVDIDEEGVEAARRAGFEAHVADCRRPQAVVALGLPRAEVVVAGEVIEHVDEPGPFLDGLHELVRPDGLLVLTTPNASGMGNAVAAVAGLEVNHPDHVTLFSYRTLSTLLGRHGFDVVEVHTFVPKLKPSETAPSPKTRLVRAGGSALLGLERALARVGAPFVADGLVVLARPTAG